MSEAKVLTGEPGGLSTLVRAALPAVLGVNQAFATYLVPTEILNARVAKFTINFDF